MRLVLDPPETRLRLALTGNVGDLRGLWLEAGVDFDELEVTPEIEEKLWEKHRVLVDEVEEVVLNPRIEKRKPGDQKRRYI